MNENINLGITRIYVPLRHNFFLHTKLYLILAANQIKLFVASR